MEQQLCLISIALIVIAIVTFITSCITMWC